MYNIEISEESLLVLAIENLIEQIVDKLLKNQELEIFIIDLDLNSKFNYDLGYYNLPEDVDNIKYSSITLYKDSDKIAKILKLATIIHTKAKKNTYSTKR
jgi:DNA topoisomerase VI subunit A